MVDLGNKENLIIHHLLANLKKCYEKRRNRFGQRLCSFKEKQMLDLKEKET